nr:MarR family winged helix-turn-helix transcriptional regulator [Rhodococcus rhodnii]
MSQPTAEAIIEEVVLFGRAMRDAIARGTPDPLPSALSSVLLVLARVGECRQSELAAELYVGPSSLSRQITELVDGGYITRAPDPSDGRAARVSLTDAGHDYIRALRERRAARLTALLADWDEDEATTTVAALRKLKTTLCAAAAADHHHHSPKRSATA